MKSETVSLHYCRFEICLLCFCCNLFVIRPYTHQTAYTEWTATKGDFSLAWLEQDTKAAARHHITHNSHCERKPIFSLQAHTTKQWTEKAWKSLHAQRTWLSRFQEWRWGLWHLFLLFVSCLFSESLSWLTSYSDFSCRLAPLPMQHVQSTKMPPTRVN